MMNARVNWLIASQAFLFVPLAIGAQGSSIARSPLFPLIPYLGLLLCILVSIAVLVAVWRSGQWTAKCANGPYAGRRAVYRPNVGVMDFDQRNQRLFAAPLRPLRRVVLPFRV
jgi:hypothetical protein